jgi:hypothetical protein
MLGLMILLSALGGTRGVVSRKRRAELLTYAPYLPPPNIQHQQPTLSERRRCCSFGANGIGRTTFVMLADRLSFAIALGFAVVLLLILLFPRPS